MGGGGALEATRARAALALEAVEAEKLGQGRNRLPSICCLGMSSSHSRAGRSIREVIVHMSRSRAGIDEQGQPSRATRRVGITTETTTGGATREARRLNLRASRTGMRCTPCELDERR